VSGHPNLTAVLEAIAVDLMAGRDELTRLDSVAGDGDLGITAGKIAAALRSVAREAGDDPPGAILRKCGADIARAAPSTCGTLVATGFLRAARAFESTWTHDVGGVAEVLDAARRGIEERGKAAAGDKTMLDALGPAVEAARAAAKDGLRLAAALERAAEAAEAGAVATAEMRAKAGRAGWLAERSQGHVDAGARLVAIGFTAAARTIGGTTED